MRGGGSIRVCRSPRRLGPHDDARRATPDALLRAGEAVNEVSRPIVLVIEDDEAIRHVLGEILGDLGYDPHVTSSIERLDPALRPACVLFDLIPIRMTYSAEAVAAWIAQLRTRWPNTPMLLLTARAEALRDATAFAPLRVMGKPFLIDALEEAVRDLVCGTNTAEPR